MPNQILLKRSDVKGKVPQLTDLALGELAVNTFDGTVWGKKNNGTESLFEVGALGNSGITAGTYTKVTFTAKGIALSGTNLTATDIPDLDWSKIKSGKPTTLQGYGITDAIKASLIGAPQGLATLDCDGKLTASQIPDSLLGAMNYKGVWDASKNTPNLTSNIASKGTYYKVSVAGNTALGDLTNWSVGDLVISDGKSWQQVQGGSSDVTSVFGRVGAIKLLAEDITGVLGFTPYANTNPANYISSNQLITLKGVVTGSGTTSITTELTKTGVTAGTYDKVTVGEDGRVLSATSGNWMPTGCIIDGGSF